MQPCNHVIGLSGPISEVAQNGLSSPVYCVLLFPSTIVANMGWPNVARPWYQPTFSVFVLGMAVTRRQQCNKAAYPSAMVPTLFHMSQCLRHRSDNPINIMARTGFAYVPSVGCEVFLAQANAAVDWG